MKDHQIVERVEKELDKTVHKVFGYTIIYEDDVDSEDQELTGNGLDYTETNVVYNHAEFSYEAEDEQEYKDVDMSEDLLLHNSHGIKWTEYKDVEMSEDVLLHNSHGIKWTGI